jgi:hypothetical protein
MISWSWDKVSEAFEFDGSWHEIYVCETDISGWQRMLDGLRSSGFDLSYFRAGKDADLPTNAEDAFPDAGMCDALLSVRCCGVLANCHFFSTDQIVFDIDPREVKGQVQLECVFRFMRCVADWVGGDAVLCKENSPQAVILRVHAGTHEIDYLRETKAE